MQQTNNVTGIVPLFDFSNEKTNGLLELIAVLETIFDERFIPKGYHRFHLLYLQRDRQLLE